MAKRLHQLNFAFAGTNREIPSGQDRRVSIYHFTVVFFSLFVLGFPFFAQIAAPCWQRHKAPKACILARLLANLLIP